jgi:hypothetical protein
MPYILFFSEGASLINLAQGLAFGFAATVPVNTAVNLLVPERGEFLD